MKKSNMPKVLFDVGSTYFKLYEEGSIFHYFRDFNIPIYEDLKNKCRKTIESYTPEEIWICSSANGGLSTLIIGTSRSFSLKYAVNTAFNSGINIIDTLLYSEIDDAITPIERIDVVIITGGIDGVEEIFDEKLFKYLKRLNYNHIVYAGSQENREYLSDNIENLVILENILDSRLKINEKELKQYLTDLYQKDIMAREDIKPLYEITANQIYPTPYIVNLSLPYIGESLDVADPFIVIDIGGATTDIHYSTDLINDNITGEGGYDRLVFKKLGVYKSRESLIFTAKRNEYVYELLNYLGVTEDIFESRSENAVKFLMQLAIFLVLYKVSKHHAEYIELKLDILNSIVLTGGISKVLKEEDAQEIVKFFYKKLLNFHNTPDIVIDRNYEIWTYGMKHLHSKERR